MKLTDFDYHLPDELIAQSPLQRRDQSRLMVVNRTSGEFHHSHFSQLPDFLPTSGVLVLNNTKVIPARLIGRKIPTGGRIEFFLTHQKELDVWEVMVKPGRRATKGTRVAFGDGILIGEVVGKTPDGRRIVRFKYKGDFQTILAQVGQVPLPPYIKRELTPADKARYQCVYAAVEGAIAAPTAGLHFTQELLDRLKQHGIDRVTLTLHVGLGTFQPVNAENIEEHHMHAEYFEVTQSAADRINTAKREGNTIVGVGTTSVRALEAAASDQGIEPYRGDTDIFIYPGYRFKMVDALITNFHLPKSTLLMLVSAFAGKELIRDAYREAIAQRYRFYSYGDAMLIL